jgi:hypothetical protein
MYRLKKLSMLLSHNIFRDRVTATSNPFRYSREGKFDDGQPQIDEMELVAGTLHVPKPRCKRPSGERGFKREVLTLVSKFVEPLQHHATSADGNSLRRERG